MPVLPLYAQRLGLSGQEIGVVIAAFAISSMALRPWAGWAADRYGRRPLMLAGGAVFLLAPLGYGVSLGAFSMTLTRLFHGAGMGLYPTAATAMAADLAPPARRAEILGIFGMAGSLALALGPALGVALSRTLGYVSLFVISTAIGALGLVLIASVRETLVERGSHRFRVRDTLHRGAVFPSLLMLSLMLTYGALITFMPLHADARGLNPGVFFLVYALALTVARQPAGKMSDRHGRAPVAAAGLAVIAGALVIVALSESGAGLIAAGIVYGIGQGIAQPALVAWSVDGAPATERGRAVGTFYTALELGIAVGGIAAGVSVARAGYAPTFFACAVLVLVAAVIAASAARARSTGTRPAAVR